MKKTIVSVILVLSACSSQQPMLVPSTTPMQINPQSASGDLLYGGGADGKHLYIFSYPAGKLLRTFAPPAGTIALQGLCSDTSGNVFVTNVTRAHGSSVMQGHVYEYAHGSTKIIKTLTFNLERPSGCSVDPKSGTLAVATVGLESRGGSLWTFGPGSYGKSYYGDNIQDFYYCAFDARGNLFVNGRGNGTQMYLNELQKGKTGLVQITLDKYVSVSGMGELQWDGTHLTLEDLTAGAIYRLSVSGLKASVIGKSYLTGWSGSGLSTIASTTVVVPTGVSENKLGFWKYPAGGKGQKFVSTPSGLFGLAISVASPR